MRLGTRWAVSVLLALSGLLAMQRYGPWQVTADDTVTEAQRPARAVGSGGDGEAPVSLPAQERYAVIGERPLFMPTRRPPEPPPPPTLLSAPRAPPPPPPAPALEVHAIVREGDRWFAMLSRSGGADAVQAEPGDAVHGWTVTEIEPEVVELQSGQRRVRLRLRPETVAPR